MSDSILSDLEKLEKSLTEAFNSNPNLEMYLKEKSGTSSLYDYGLTLYTDGSSKEGKNGFGIHGYLWRKLIEVDPKAKKLGDQGIPKSFPTDRGYLLKSNVKDQNDIKTVILANDVSIPNTDKIAYTPSKVEIITYLDICSSEMIKDATNNRAEMIGLIYALRMAGLFDISQVHIRSDSRVAINTLLAWGENWAANSWKKSNGETPANLDLVKLMLVEKERVKNHDFKTTIEWVKGHLDFIGNITADKMATRGRILAIKEITDIHIDISDPVGYWKEELSINPLLSEPRFYYTTAENAGILAGFGHVYHIGSHGKKDEMIGKKMSDINCSVVILKAPDIILEKIRHATREIRPFQDGTLYDCRLDVISKPVIYNEIIKNGFKFMYLNKETGFVMSYDSLPILRIPRAPHLTFRAQGYFVYLENLLVDYMTGTLSPDYVITDITDSIYSRSTDTKGKEKIKVIDVMESAYKVNVDYPGMSDKRATITLTYGIDIPRRLNLMRLSTDIDKVQVITWKEGNVSFRYITLIITKSGDCGVWAGAHSNLRFVLDKSK